MGWIGVDLDGTLAHYTDWKTQGNTIGEPIPPMVARVQSWLREGKDVRIFTARLKDDIYGIQENLIGEWCEKHIGEWLPSTNCKDRHMEQLWDDRVVQVLRNTGLTLF